MKRSYAGTASPIPVRNAPWLAIVALLAYAVSWPALGAARPDLAADIILFTANPYEPTSSINVLWQTGTEIDHLGFFLYRNESPDDRGEELAFFPAEGGVSGWYYQYSDNQVQRGITYWYTLVSVSLDGTEDVEGPISATLGTPTASSPTPTPTAATATPTPTTPLAATSTPTTPPTATPTPTVLPENTTTVVPTASPTPTTPPTATPTPTPTSPASQQSPTAGPSPTPTATLLATPTPFLTPTGSPTPMAQTTPEETVLATATSPTDPTPLPVEAPPALDATGTPEPPIVDEPVETTPASPAASPTRILRPTSQVVPSRGDDPNGSSPSRVLALVAAASCGLALLLVAVIVAVVLYLRSREDM